MDASVKLQWQVNDRTMLYLSYAEGSKGGGFAGASGSVLAENFEFGPESSTSYEVGAKLDVFGGRGFVGLAAFTTTYEDLQTASFNGVAFDFANAAEADTRGVEVESSLTLNDEWQLNASLAYLDAEYEKYVNGACIAPNHVIPGCVEDLDGTDLPNAPKWSGRLDVQYLRPVADLVFTADLGVSFRDDYFVHPSLFDEVHQDAYAKLDLRLELASEARGWSVALLGKNLTDEETFSQGFETPGSAPPGAIPDHTTATQLMDIGRTVAVQARYEL